MRTEVGLIIWESSGILEAARKLLCDQCWIFPEENSQEYLAPGATQ